MKGSEWPENQQWKPVEDEEGGFARKLGCVWTLERSGGVASSTTNPRIKGSIGRLRLFYSFLTDDRSLTVGFECFRIGPRTQRLGFLSKFIIYTS